MFDEINKSYEAFAVLCATSTNPMTLLISTSTGDLGSQMGAFQYLIEETDMLKIALRSALVLMSLGVASAYAADTASSQNSQSSSGSTGQDPSGSMNVRQEIQTSLSKQGYTDVSVMPTSFLVHAKDSKGQPVAMVIGPDSVTTVTELPPPGQSGSNSDSKKPASK